MQQHVLDDRIGTLAMLNDLFEIAPQHIGQFGDLGARLLVDRYAAFRASCNSSISSAEIAEKLLTKLSGFLISCAMPAVSWPSEASFSVCTRRSCAVRKFSSDAASSRVRVSTLFEEANILDCDNRLVGECLNQLDLFVGEWAHGFALENDDADGRPFAQQRHAQHRANAARGLPPPSSCIPDRPGHQGCEWLAPSITARPTIEPRPAAIGWSAHIGLRYRRVKPYDATCR